MSSKHCVLATFLPAAMLALALSTPAAALSSNQSAFAQTDRTILATADMRSRLAAAIERVSVAEQHGKLPAGRSVTVRRALGRAQAQLAQRSRQGGHVEANTLARYDRLVQRIDDELSANAYLPLRRVDVDRATIERHAIPGDDACHTVQSSLRVPPSGKCPEEEKR